MSKLRILSKTELEGTVKSHLLLPRISVGPILVGIGLSVVSLLVVSALDGSLFDLTGQEVIAEKLPGSKNKLGGGSN